MLLPRTVPDPSTKMEHGNDMAMTCYWHGNSATRRRTKGIVIIIIICFITHGNISLIMMMTMTTTVMV